MSKEFLTAFEYPFETIGSDDRYILSEMYVPMFDKNMKSKKIDLRKVKIPKNITEVYWYKEGIPDEADWEFLGKIKYGKSFKYIYFVAWCDYTGFDCQGGMKFYLDDSREYLEKYAKKEIVPLVEKYEIVPQSDLMKIVRGEF